ncbi:hypothetical protein FEZ32_03865 [Acidipropionibacterium jensenii]|uniref:hypothetical protein n=1 Tax=Acidipropionibacterium jensenii TaxID=1749 RepID=UPI00110A9A13|nr:hypothetical protein [Acidipropionibacterium jensenii]QCV87621.1 hypothetical protein FEZ32_03865 [Acidipropionibacterium jensenii]
MSGAPRHMNHTSAGQNLRNVPAVLPGLEQVMTLINSDRVKSQSGWRTMTPTPWGYVEAVQRSNGGFDWHIGVPNRNRSVAEIHQAVAAATQGVFAPLSDGGRFTRAQLFGIVAGSLTCLVATSIAGGNGLGTMLGLAALAALWGIPMGERNKRHQAVADMCTFIDPSTLTGPRGRCLTALAHLAEMPGVTESTAAAMTRCTQQGPASPAAADLAEASVTVMSRALGSPVVDDTIATVISVLDLVPFGAERTVIDTTQQMHALATKLQGWKSTQIAHMRRDAQQNHNRRQEEAELSSRTYVDQVVTPSMEAINRILDAEARDDRDW